MIRRPPRSTLFPYTRSSDLTAHYFVETVAIDSVNRAVELERFLRRQVPPKRVLLAHRSEEHTSELQSLAYLVCRLLLENKKSGPDFIMLMPTITPMPRVTTA